MAGDEIVLIVDGEDRIVDQVPRHIMRAQSLRHRATYIFVFDSGGRLFVQRRTASKDIYPGYFDLAAGGVVCAGETYEASARRELQEELGVWGAPLIPQFKHCFEQQDNRCWGMVFTCLHDGPFQLQVEEIASGGFVDIDTIRNGDITPITPDNLVIFERLGSHFGLFA